MTGETDSLIPGREKRWVVASRPLDVPCYTRLSTKWDDGRYDSVRIFEHPLAQMVRALGRAGYTSARVRRLMDALALKDVRINSIRTWVSKRGEDPAAELTAEQMAALDHLAPED